jgi:predicted permease
MPVIDEVLILFIMMSAGFYARRTSMLNAGVNRGLAEILLNITMPCMIVGAFNLAFDAAMIHLAAQVLLASVVLHGAVFFISGWIYRSQAPDKAKILRFTAIFSNCAFMGYPVLQSVYGKAGVFYGSIFTVPFIISLWTVGVFLFHGRRDTAVSWQKVAINPGILAVLAGLILFIFQVKLPVPLMRACDLLGAMTTPLAMILIGSMLAEIHWKELMSGKAVYLAAAVRLIAIPLMTFMVLLAFGVRGIVLGVCVISAAMPAAANTAAFAEKFGADALFASRCVFISTLFSILTIPAIIALVQIFAAG